MNFDYFYGEQSEQYAFYRTPKVFYTDQKFRGLSSDAKILYGILLDRVSLSAKNEWHDEDGRVYVFMTINSVEYSIVCWVIVQREYHVWLVQILHQPLKKFKNETNQQLYKPF